MDVLLVNPTRNGGDSYVTPPLHLLYIANAIRKAGHKAKIIDVHYDYYKSACDHKCESKNDFENAMIKEIIKCKFDLLGIGSIVSAFDFTKRLVNAVKLTRPYLPVIIGGGMSIALKDLWLEKTNADFLVESDGEIVIQKFLEAYPRMEELQKIPGLHVRTNGKFVFTEPDLPKNLDYIEFPDWEILDNLDDYMNMQKSWVNLTLPPDLLLSGGDRLLPVVMTRGCSYKCTFCYHVNNLHRKHSVEYVVSYLKYLKLKYKITHVVTWDDLIMVDRKWLSDLCDELATQKIGLRIFCSGGKPDILTRDLLSKMAHAGFMRISYGIESGSQKMLDIMKKKTTVLQNYNAVKMSTQEGIFVHLNMVAGMPGEDTSTLRETSTFLTSLAKEGIITSKNVSFSYATGYPGTELYQYMLDNKIVIDTEDYLKKQTGVGAYKYNLSGMNANSMAYLLSGTLIKVNLYHSLYMKRYPQALWYILRGIVNIILSMLPASAKKVIKSVLYFGKNR